MSHRPTPVSGSPRANGHGIQNGVHPPPSVGDPVGPPEKPPLPPVQGVRSTTAADAALGQKIRSLRRARVLTQKELAGMVGVTGAQLHRYETGGTRIAASRLVALAQALGVRPDSLIASCAAEPEPPPAAVEPGSVGDELLELIQVFTGLTDPRHRSAVLSIARMFPGAPAEKTDSET